VPEYLNVELGRNESANRNVRRYYTLHDRVRTAAAVIDRFLRENQYEHVALMGYSEGALILARVYLSLKQRDEVERLIFLSYGGMSQYHTLRLLQQKYGDMKGALLSNQSAIDEVIVKVNTDPLSIDRWWLGWPYQRWSTFGPYEPLSDLLTIDIPILMLHGTQDMQVPVESSRMAAEEFRKAGKPSFKYIEYPGEGHVFHEDFKSVIHDVENWLSREDP
jgi:pimeloyl-ACP methyl ester carboxylesterase